MSASPRVAVITGASRGIGRACADALAAAGLDLYLVADGTPEEIAEVVRFLATTDATFMTGNNVVIDGGYITH